MVDIIQIRLAELKRQFDDHALTDEDYYESEDIASCDADEMFQYFRDELDESQKSQLLKRAKESKLFLHDLIGVGETLLAVAEEVSATLPLSWADISELPSRESSARQVRLARSEGLKLDVAPMQVLAAESSDLDVTCELRFGATINVYRDNDQLVIKVIGEDSSLDGQLVGYCVSGAKQDLLGFILLRKGVLGTVSGMVRLDRAAISGKQTINFSLVEYSDLCNADFPLLEKTVFNDVEDQRSIEAWRRWINAINASEDGPGLAQALKRLESLLP